MKKFGIVFGICLAIILGICLAFFAGRVSAMYDCIVDISGNEVTIELDGQIYAHETEF